MNEPNAGGRPPEPALTPDRQRLADLIGRLLARHWRRAQVASPDSLVDRRTRETSGPERQ